ncbi:MAG: DUF2493 domain-containing protein [Ruminococcaceae bacterium]|nr:DUF2493 domain-containing protein [Oscillospiraceae bacterium]
MKLLIVGSRGIEDFSLGDYIPKEVEWIISGGASGVDALAEQYADEHKLSKLILRPQYDRYGRAAPLKRNKEMVELCDEVLVIWDGVSHGTKYTIECAKRKNKPLRVVIVENRQIN